MKRLDAPICSGRMLDFPTQPRAVQSPNVRPWMSELDGQDL